MAISHSGTLKEVLKRIQHKVAESWPCRRCGVVQPVQLLTEQNDLCQSCLLKFRDRNATEKIHHQIGPKYTHCRFENFRPSPSSAPALQVLRNFVQDPRGGIFLYGPSGTGKTHLGTAMMRCFIEEGKDCRYITMPELLIRLKRSDPLQLSPQEELFGHCNAPMLILDDLNIGHITDWTCQMIHLLLDRRDRYLKPVILIANLSLDRVAMLLGDPVASRIAGMCQIVQMQGDDHRLSGP